jgi:integrase
MKKRRLATGIYEDKSGIAIRISVRGEPLEFRHNEQGQRYTGWALDKLIVERKRIDAREHLKEDRRQSARTSLRADVQQYLRTIADPGRRKVEGRFAHWLPTFGDRQRSTITAVELREHAATWTCAPSTFNHRRQVLINLYKTLDGPRADNPAREIPKRKDILGAPKALPYSTIEAIFATMPATKSRARLKLMAYTGLPQMQISKLTPTDWQGARLRVSPRRKGAGTAGRIIPLSPEAQAAMAEFAAADAWGTFSTPSLRNLWLRHAPKGTRPYDLRHSWITELYRRSNGDVLAVQQLALHSRLEQTQRYAAAALDERMDALVLPRSATTTTRRKQGKSGETRGRKPTARKAHRRRKTR